MTAEASLGPVVDTAPARPPEPTVLEGAHARLEPVDPDRHLDALFLEGGGEASADIWRYMGNGPFLDREAMRTYLAGAAGSRDPLFFTILDRASGAARGVASYLRIEPNQRVIEVGHIWFGPSLKRTVAATEAMYLMARHAFDDLGYRRYEWKCNALNAASQRAAERLGFTFEGVFRQHMIVKGRSRDTAWFSMLDREWPVARHAFERWLDPGNFDADGRQRHGLAELRAALRL